MDSNEFVRYMNLVPYFSYTKVIATMSVYALELGRGDYATAFHLSDGKVAKLYKAHDYAYRTFLMLIKNSTSPHLPKIFHTGNHKKFGWVILEFLDPCQAKTYMEVAFSDCVSGMKSIICGKKSKIELPSTLVNLAEEMKSVASGLALDFREPNFGFRGDTLVPFDPFAIKTKDNTNLEFVEGEPLLRRSR